MTVLKRWLRIPEPVYAMKIGNAEDFMDAAGEGAPIYRANVPPLIWCVDTAHGPVSAEWGDYLVTDGKGDWWPVKAAIFEERYREIRA